MSTIHLKRGFERLVDLLSYCGSEILCEKLSAILELVCAECGINLPLFPPNGSVNKLGVPRNKLIHSSKSIASFKSMRDLNEESSAPKVILL
jgi:hypothetical protein